MIMMGEFLLYRKKNRDEEIRRQSSSGGFFTFIAENIIKDGGEQDLPLLIIGHTFSHNPQLMHNALFTLGYRNPS